MELCEICAEEKPYTSFIKIKGWKYFNLKDVMWCRVCQRMYRDMKEFEKAKERLAKNTTGIVEFT
jgi:hypothetical protein